ncbi:MAG: NADH-quinone oxidoreductase subunit B family protein [Candidatus Micrarchaeota archaeon]|nr:NADH-quinone oxidoreductase subunit B family protein [Candidatus Micrarchaeota archaeon]
MRRFMARSPWVYHLNTGSCNGCDIEIIAALSPRYDAERAGVKLVGSPKLADIILVTGPVTKQMKERVINIVNQVPNPRAIVVVGVCGATTGVFDGAYSIDGPIDKFFPVDVYVTGCPPRPEAIVLGILKAAGKLAKGETGKRKEAAK